MTAELKNKICVTLACFLAYFVMSSILSPLGLLSGALATRYSLDITETTALFSYVTTGVLVGSLLSLFLNPRLGSKRVLQLSCSTLILILLIIWGGDRASILPVSFSVIGAACGLMLATAAIVLTESYSINRRATALLATDSFYSLGGMLVNPLAAILIASAAPWSTVYGVTFLVSLLILLLATRATFPDVGRSDAKEKDETTWPVSVFLVGAALLLYLICFITIYAWVPNHGITQYAISTEESGTLVSGFFFGLLIGQVIVFFISFKVSAKWLVCSAGLLVCLFSVGLPISPTIHLFSISVIFLGIAAGGFLKPLIALGTLIVPRPSDRLVGFYMFCTALGSSLAPVLSAFIVDQIGTIGLMYCTVAGFFVTFALIGCALIIKSKEVSL